jgi:D-alanine-D-alanine ligase
VKWDKKYQKKHGINTYEAKELSPAIIARLDKLSRRIYRCLGLSGCARIDYRLTADGQIYVIEANPNPNLAAEEDFAQSALAAGVGYPELLEKLLALGAGYQAEWRAYYG